MDEKNKKPGRKVPIHAGHRQRMTETFLKAGIDGFSDVQVLEYLLGYAIPRVDTNPIAHRLLDEFGSLFHVFNASIPRLTKVEGVGLRAACLIRFVGESQMRSEQSKYGNDTYLRTTEEIGDYLIAHLSNYREERAFLLCLDGKCRVLELRLLCTGDVNVVNVPFRKVAETALLCGAESVVFAHNHVNGPGIHSREDVIYTNGLAALLRKMNINLIDHMVISERSYISLMKSAGIDPESGLQDL